MAGQDFDAFKTTINRTFMHHPVVTQNAYTEWFARGAMSMDHLRDFTVQFSVFSSQFLLAALNRVINANSLDAARESKEILMNELGVSYTKQGHVDTGTFRFEAAHLEWILHFAESLGLGFNDIGKRRHGSRSTLFFCDELFELYGSEDYNEAMGAAFAVENWAAAGFWKQLIAGLEQVKRTRVPHMPLGFFTWHDRLEETHKAHVWEELAACYASPAFAEAPFITAGMRMLDGVKMFWDGLLAVAEEERPAA
jgi:pyrroloquinoline quinone (PQQ) biosynthesis protein C